MPILVIGAMALTVFGIIGGLLSLAVILEGRSSRHAQGGMGDIHHPPK